MNSNLESTNIFRSNKMNTKLIEKWIKALRSGDYKQGRQCLRNKYNEYCCLGVLCDISKKHLGVDWEPEYTDDFEMYIMEKNGGVLPNSVWEYLGKEVNFKVNLSTRNSKIPKAVTESSLYHLIDISLVTLNDVYGLSFNQIADILEEEFLNEN